MPQGAASCLAPEVAARCSALCDETTSCVLKQRLGASILSYLVWQIDDKMDAAEKKREQVKADKLKAAEANEKKGKRARARHQVALQQAQELETGGGDDDGGGGDDDDDDDQGGKTVEF